MNITIVTTAQNDDDALILMEKLGFPFKKNRWYKMAKKSMIVKRIKNKNIKLREYNRCPLTGRPRGFIRKYGMSRNAFRKLASEGLIPGVKKS